ncbi:MAG: DMT family transporter [Clostridiaceae bacterium]|nr:DMT family transporter [Clostridiaceae bacterium]
MGYFYVVLAAVLFGAAPTFQRQALLTGVTPAGLMVMTNGVTVLGAAVFALPRRRDLRVSGRQLLHLALMGVSMGLTGLLLNYAYNYLAVGFVTMIHFLYPSVVCIAMALFFREKLTPLKAGAAAVSVGGLALLSGGGSAGSFTGVLLAALSSLTYGFYVISNEKGSANTLPTVVKVMYSMFFSLMMNLCVALGTKAVFPFSGPALLPSLLAGVMIGSATFLLCVGIRHLGASTSAFINMLEPVTSLLVSALVYRYAVSARSGLGCALVLSSVLMTALGSRKIARR